MVTISATYSLELSVTCLILPSRCCPANPVRSCLRGWACNKLWLNDPLCGTCYVLLLCICTLPDYDLCSNTCYKKSLVSALHTTLVAAAACCIEFSLCISSALLAAASMSNQELTLNSWFSCSANQSVTKGIIQKCSKLTCACQLPKLGRIISGRFTLSLLSIVEVIALRYLNQLW